MYRDRDGERDQKDLSSLERKSEGLSNLFLICISPLPYQRYYVPISGETGNYSFNASLIYGFIIVTFVASTAARRNLVNATIRKWKSAHLRNINFSSSGSEDRKRRH